MIRTDEGTLLYEAACFLGKRTNNAAEYLALIEALRQARRWGQQPLCVYSDSQLLVRQMTGEYEVRSSKLAPLYREAQMLLLHVPGWSFRHVRREENQRADELANMAMDQRRDVVVFDAGDGGEDHDAAEQPPPSVAEDQAGDDQPALGPAAAASQGSADHAVRVVLAEPLPGDECPAGVCLPREFTVQSVLPAELCVYAAQAILPTLLAILHTDPREFAAVPTLTVRCNRHDCPAVFHLAPVHSPNGNRRRDTPKSGT